MAIKDPENSIIFLFQPNDLNNVDKVSSTCRTCALMCDCDAPGGENMNYIASTEILPNHTLPNLDQIYAISEVINNINKKHTLFQRLINISHLFSIGVTVAENFV